ncbi:alanine aminotransferase 2-like [Dunckerocampus dactyliophorus]|uniref:alanine aminotransferase 2-like n=1 Tax=Dunckerocampus dactyliophorus TaxID=161453 RepID=UPI0024073FFF|nr:alanine aminotransferase 2-like [Dunckerocampus dactyliophorus]
MSCLEHVNPRVRGIGVPPLAHLQRLAVHITQEINLGVKKPFKEVIDVSSGDPHKSGMKPISFVRQVLAGCIYPQLLKGNHLPPDASMRAQKLLEVCDGNSVGSYTASSGLLHVKQSIAEFIERRDGISAHTSDIFISAGSQRALMVVVKLLASGEGETPTGVLTPIPCPHTLPMLLDEEGVMLVPYQLIEDQGWAIDLEELNFALKTPRGGYQPRAIYISNPGNPTGNVQDRKSIEEVIGFAARQKLLLLVDEVYQDSVHEKGRQFISYKKVLFEMGKEYSEMVELISFNSLSTACMGECGLRAGYMEAVNIDPQIMQVFDTMLCTDISTPVTGQLALDLMVNPPKPMDASFDVYAKEMFYSWSTLSQNAQRAHEYLNNLPGITCQPAMGGMYIFPRLQLPSQLVHQAKMLEVDGDVIYCQRLLQEEGVFVGPGGLNMRNNADCYIRVCILVPPDTLTDVLARLSSFHRRHWANTSSHPCQNRT